MPRYNEFFFFLYLFFLCTLFRIAIPAADYTETERTGCLLLLEHTRLKRSIAPIF